MRGRNIPKSMSPAALKALLEGKADNFFAATTPGGIEAQEAAGQKEMVNAAVARLPKEIGGHWFQTMSAEQIYALVGIEVLGEYDDIFFNVELPTGWTIKETSHSMWSELFDHKNRKRASIFYKAAFYDRSARLSFNPRFEAVVQPEDAYKSDITFEEREQSPYFGRVYDCGNIVFETEGVVLKSREKGGYEYRCRQEDNLRKQAEDWLVQKGYSAFMNVMEYWD